MQRGANTPSNKHTKNFLIHKDEGFDEEEEDDCYFKVISRVHPKGKGGHTDEGVCTRVRVSQQELLKDVKEGMPLRHLLPKYRLPQKKAQENLIKALESLLGEKQATELVTNKKRTRATTYEKDHPSRLALCFVREEREFLMQDFRDTRVRSLCVEGCLGRDEDCLDKEDTSAQLRQNNIQETIAFLKTLNKDTRFQCITLINKLIGCFESQEKGLPSEVSSGLLDWVKNLLKDLFAQIPAAMEQPRMKDSGNHRPKAETKIKRKAKRTQQTGTKKRKLMESRDEKKTSLKRRRKTKKSKLSEVEEEEEKEKQPRDDVTTDAESSKPATPMQSSLENESTTTTTTTTEDQGSGIVVEEQTESHETNQPVTDNTPPEQPPLNADSAPVMSQEPLEEQQQVEEEEEEEDLVTQERMNTPSESQSPNTLITKAGCNKPPKKRHASEWLHQHNTQEKSLDPTEPKRVLRNKLLESWDRLLLQNKDSSQNISQYLLEGNWLNDQQVALLLLSVALYQCEPMFPVINSILMATCDPFRSKSKEDATSYFADNGWDPSFRCIYLMVHNGSNHYTGLFVVRNGSKALLEAMVCDSLASPRRLNPSERSALNKLKEYLLCADGVDYKCNVYASAKRLGNCRIPKQQDTYECGFCAAFLYPLLLRAKAFPHLLSEGASLASAMRQAFPSSAQAFVSLSKELGKELASSSRNLLHACHKMMRTILATDPGVDQVLCMEDCSTSNGLKEEDQQHRNETTPKETDEASEVNTDGRAQLRSSSSGPDLSRTSSPPKQQRKRSNNAKEQPKSPRRLIRLVAGWK